MLPHVAALEPGCLMLMFLASLLRMRRVEVSLLPSARSFGATFERLGS